MRIHRDAGLLYLAHPRTASTSTEVALERAGFTDPIPGRDKHSRATALPGDARRAFHIATNVRHHFDALVSWFFHEHADMDFGPEWIQRTVEDSPYLSPGQLYGLHLGDADTVLRFETLEDDLNGWLEGVGLGPVDLPHYGESEAREGRPWQEFYDPPTLRFVEGYFFREMDRLGYGWAA